MFNYIYNTVYYKYFNNYDKFKNILELIPNKFNKIRDQYFDNSDPLINCIKTFCENENTNKFIVSLSGGVDSMVLISIIHCLGYQVIALHINYNNRDETVLEQQFIKEWCHLNEIKLYIKEVTEIKRNSSKRSNYEIFTKKLRFNFYEDILNKELCDIILLAHHKDDIVENIFANVCRGRYILDLAVIKEKSLVNSINIARPLITFYKSYIYDFAKQYEVPYFKDTTPIWSIRGKYRNDIFPILENTFSSNIKNNLIGISQQSYEWNQLITKEIIKPFNDKLKYLDNYVTFNIEKYISYPLCFWNIVFMNIFYRFGKNCPSRKGIQTFMNSINSIPNTGYSSISNACVCYIKNNDVKIEFKLQI